MTDIKKFPFIVSFKDRANPTSDLRWKPTRPDTNLETAMVTPYQRGGIHGDFQTMDGKVEMEMFIPLTAIRSVETRTSQEKRAAKALENLGREAQVSGQGQGPEGGQTPT